LVDEIDQGRSWFPSIPQITLAFIPEIAPSSALILGRAAAVRDAFHKCASDEIEYRPLKWAMRRVGTSGPSEMGFAMRGKHLQFPEGKSASLCIGSRKSPKWLTYITPTPSIDTA